MKRTAYASGDISGRKPDWYWHRGLHDALILGTEEIALPYDFTQRDPIRNCFKIHLDASQALFDTTVRSISLYNYKVLRALEQPLTGCYWKQDILRSEKGKYVLELTVLGKTDMQLIVRFEDAQVER